MTESSLLIERSGSLVILTLNRPAVGNAIDLEMSRELMRAAIECDEDSTVRCVLLAGAGSRFCVGGDLQSITAAVNIGAYVKELTGTLHIAIAHLTRMKKPLVTAAQGAIAGAGVSLAIIGDIALAGRASTFSWAYSAVGLTPDGGLSWFLPRLIGLRRAQEFAFLGKRWTGEEAAALGVVTKTVDDDKLMSEAKATASQLAAGATRALGATRELFLHGALNGLESQMEFESRSIAHAAVHGDGPLGIEAFKEKRKPIFGA